jgi:DNA cross-link repair 1C protein
VFYPRAKEHASTTTAMPTGAPFHSFIRPYPIRVDAFATPADPPDYQVPSLYLLTHTHTDHLAGLLSNSFGAVVVCSPAAKEMLLNLEPTHERITYDKGLRRDRLRPYASLRIDAFKTKTGKMDYTYARDLLVSNTIGL